MKQTPGRRLATGSHGATAGPPLVTFTSDFGTGSPLVAAMKAMVLAGCPHATLVDVSHEVPHFDVFAGAFMLFAGTRHFGPASVHLAVVDPGVGSARRRLAIRAGGRFYVGPDNGLFGIVIEEVGMPPAAALASGVPLESLGHPTSAPKMLDDSGPRVLWVDGFGNLVTNLKPPIRPMRIHNHYITASAKTYAEARPNEPFVYLGSMGYLEVGIREARADRVLGARPGMRVDLL